MTKLYDTRPIAVDQHGHRQGGGQIIQHEMNMANLQQANRVLSHGVTGRLSNIGGVPRVSEFLAVPEFPDDVDVATGTLGPTKATLDASLDAIADAVSGLFVDANAVAALLGVATVVDGSGGTPASPIGAVGDSGTLAVTGPTKANMDVIRVDINTNMHTLGALVNKLLRNTRHHALLIETSPMRQPPPDDYNAGSIGGNPPTGDPPPAAGDPVEKGGGSGLAFGAESPYTDPTPAIGVDSGAFAGTGQTKADMDDALTTWRDNLETLAYRMAVVTFTVVALTDNSGGTAQADDTLDLCTPDAENGFPADQADGGNTLADDADTDASLVEVRNAIEELAEKARELDGGLATGSNVYDGGGVGVDDTIAAIDTTISTTATATGPQKASLDAWALEADQAFDQIAVMVNRQAIEVGVGVLSRAIVAVGTESGGGQGNPVNRDVSEVYATDGELDPFPGTTIPVTGGDADPGQVPADVSAALVRAQNNVALLAAKINEVRAALQAPLVRIA